MSPPVLARAFEPFFSTKESSRGSGLGLSSVQAIVADAGGRVELDSALGRGTMVTVRLPLVAAPAPESHPGPVPELPKGEGRLLVVDDEPAVRRVVARYLTRAGYEALEQENGWAALQYLEQQAPTVQLVLTDLVMPGMSGQELASRIAERWPHVRVLFMSGTSGVIPGRNGTWASTPVIAKPVELPDVAARVAEALRAERV